MKKRLLLVLSLSLLIAALVAPKVQAGGGVHCDLTITDERTTTVTLAQNCFFPTIARIDVGDEITFISKDHGVPHTITGALYAFGDMDDVMGGDERMFTFDEEGIYPYVCIIHPGMAGAVVVGDGEGKVSSSSVTGGTVVPPSNDSAGSDARSDAASEPAAEPTSTRSEANLWVLAAAVTIALALAGAMWLPRGKTPQPEV